MGCRGCTVLAVCRIEIAIVRIHSHRIGRLACAANELLCSVREVVAEVVVLKIRRQRGGRREHRRKQYGCQVKAAVRQFCQFLHLLHVFFSLYVRKACRVRQRNVCIVPYFAVKDKQGAEKCTLPDAQLRVFDAQLRVPPPDCP